MLPPYLPLSVLALWEPLFSGLLHASLQGTFAIWSICMMQEGTKGGQNRPQQGHRCHYGCIVALQRSPFLPNVIMSAGGYDWALYTDDFLPAALMRSPSAPVQYTCAAWSTTRPGVA